jgi:hypothetical protein
MNFHFRHYQRTVSVIRNQCGGHTLFLLVSTVHQLRWDRTTDSYRAPWVQQQCTTTSHTTRSRPVSKMEINSSFTHMFSCKSSLHTLTVKLKILQPIHNLMKIYKLFSIRLWPSGLSCSVVSWTIEEENNNSKFSALLLSRWWSHFPLKFWQHSTKLQSLNAKNKILLFTTKKTSNSN